MKRLFFSFLLMTFSLSVSAEWVFFSSSIEYDEWYVDFSSKKVNNGTVKIWIKNKYGKLNGDTYGYISQMEFNCSNDSRRDLYTIFYSDSEFKKVYLIDSKLTEWKPNVPESIIKNISEMVCKS